jgi:hypothetical protein
MSSLGEAAPAEIAAHAAFMCGYGLLLAEVVRGSRGTRALRKGAVAVGAITLATAHAYVALQLFNSHPDGAVVKWFVADRVEIARKADRDLAPAQKSQSPESQTPQRNVSSSPDGGSNVGALIGQQVRLTTITQAVWTGQLEQVTADRLVVQGPGGRFTMPVAAVQKVDRIR